MQALSMTIFLLGGLACNSSLFSPGASESTGRTTPHDSAESGASENEFNQHGVPKEKPHDQKSEDAQIPENITGSFLVCGEMKKTEVFASIQCRVATETDPNPDISALLPPDPKDAWDYSLEGSEVAPISSPLEQSEAFDVTYIFPGEFLDDAPFADLVLIFSVPYQNSQIHLTYSYIPKGDLALIPQEDTTNDPAPEDPAPAETSTPPVSCESSGGIEIAAACWFYGASGQSCAQVCTGKGLGYDEATRTFAGSGGSASNCREVLDALGVAGSSVGTLSCFLGNPQVGCHYHEGWGRWSCSDSTTRTASSSSKRRACACK